MKFWQLLLVACVAAWAQDVSTDFDIASVSGQNCTFLADRDSFLKHDLRARLAIHERLTALDKSREAAAVAMASPTTSVLPRNNFIDDEIFNKLDALGVAPAALATDEEFFRRINLDLTGRIPSAADARAFVADASPSKRSALIDKLLFTPEYVDKWTMWMGDLLENNVTSVNFTRQISGRNAFYKFIWGSVLNQDSWQDIATRILTAAGNDYDEPTAAGYII